MQDSSDPAAPNSCSQAAALVNRPPRRTTRSSSSSSRHVNILEVVNELRFSEEPVPCSLVRLLHLACRAGRDATHATIRTLDLTTESNRQQAGLPWSLLEHATGLRVVRLFCTQLQQLWREGRGATEALAARGTSIHVSGPLPGIAEDLDWMGQITALTVLHLLHFAPQPAVMEGAGPDSEEQQHHGQQQQEEHEEEQQQQEQQVLQPATSNRSSSSSRLWHLPSSLGQLTLLQKLKVRLVCVPSVTLGELVTSWRHLTCLWLESVGLQELPGSMSSLVHLERLIVPRNALTELPLALAQLPRLRLVDAEENNLQHLPVHLTQVTGLVLYESQELLAGAPTGEGTLFTAPAAAAGTGGDEQQEGEQQQDERQLQLQRLGCLSRLVNLKYLDISDCVMAVPPPGLDCLTNLEKLSLGGTHVVEGVYDLPSSLTSFDLQANCLNSYSSLSNLSSCSGLAELWLSSSDESGGPGNVAALGVLPSLCKLKIGWGTDEHPVPDLEEWLLQQPQLVDLELELQGDSPQVLTRLPTQLTDLKLFGVHEVPPAFAGLANLRDLTLDGYGIQELPGWLTCLQQLAKVYFWGHNIPELPPVLLELPHLATVFDAMRIWDIPDHLSHH